MKNTTYTAILLSCLMIQACSKNNKPFPPPPPPPPAAPNHVPAAMLTPRMWSGYIKDTSYYGLSSHYYEITDSVCAITRLSDTSVSVPFTSMTLSYSGTNSTTQTDTFRSLLEPLPYNPRAKLVYYTAADSFTYSYDYTPPTESSNTFSTRLHTHK